MINVCRYRFVQHYKPDSLVPEEIIHSDMKHWPNVGQGPYLYKLRYTVGFGLVEMTISTNPKSTVYNLYENTDPALCQWIMLVGKKGSD